MSQIIIIGQIQQNFAQNILGGGGFKFIQTKGHVLFQGEIIRTYDLNLWMRTILVRTNEGKGDKRVIE